MKYFAVLFLSLGSMLLSSCSDSNAQSFNDNLNDFVNIDFVVVSQGYQTDQEGGQLLVANNQQRFTDIWQTIPSISGETPNPDFESNQVAIILTTISVCSSLEITSVSENEETILLEATKVTTTNPGLCDPTPEAFGQRDYAMVEFARTSKPVSIIYRARDEF
ncbi:hypothetical protein [Gynuella sunshinyii]|uniref:Lipoprotein n=1 Tax=Gynuella sunshinyii YC6258 TaxID=1445510 RepID=A0A0C5VSK9_9GAMM|nr:hypothetical protein [Gynuella sunshinyii]AJQ97201.1 hypothetical Protein YC6258_05171 [Gynuella sunshinyii YC6258]